MSLENCEKILVFMGKSASGKDTLVNMISEKYMIPIAKSFTTRPMRSGETQGVEYIFISEEEMEQKLANNEIMEYTSYYIQSENRTYMYGSSLEELTKGRYVLAIVNPHGLYQLQRSPLKDKLVTILLDCDDRIRLIRCLERDENINIYELIDRFNRDDLDFTQRCPKTDYIVDTSGEFADAYNEVEHIINNILKGEDAND